VPFPVDVEIVKVKGLGMKVASAPNEQGIIDVKRLANKGQETGQRNRHEEQNGCNRAWGFPVQDFLPVDQTACADKSTAVWRPNVPNPDDFSPDSPA
jgi:hypothetical protein